MKILAVAVIGLVAILLAFILPGILDATVDFRTDQVTEEFGGNTAVNITSANVQLSSPLWNSVLTDTDVSTNQTSDSPYLSSYNSTNRQVTINGLAGNSTRTVTIVYMTAGLGEYTAADDFSTKLPTLVLVFIIILAVSGVVAVIVYAVKRR